MRTMFDAAFPPSHPPPADKIQVAAGYIGGNTPHIWTDAEWDRMPQQQRLPIYTCSHPELHNADVDSTRAADWLIKHNVPKDCLVALDLETAINPTYVWAFDAGIVRAGYRLIIYGSKSTLFQNPVPSGGYWVAAWTGVPHLESRSRITQYASNTMLNVGWDLNTVADDVVFWTIGDLMPDQAYFDGAFAALKTEVLNAYRQLDHGTTEKEAAPNSLKEIVGKYNNLSARVAVVEAAVQAGIPVNLTDAQLAVFGQIIASELATAGLKLSGTMTGTIELGADA